MLILGEAAALGNDISPSPTPLPRLRKKKLPLFEFPPALGAGDGE